MPIWKASSLCKDLVILPCNIKMYQEYSKEMISILHEYAPVVEQASIDEAYLDLTGTEYIYPNLYELAKEIQDQILCRIKIRCSIGISENKLLAKMASDYKKPMGITTILRGDVRRLLWNLPVSELYGVGEKTNEILKKIGIHKIVDLAKCNKDILKIYVGEKNAIRLIESANGIDKTEVISNEFIQPQSCGLEKTYSTDVMNMDELEETLLEFSQSLSYRLKKMQKKAKTINIKIKYANFQTITRSYTLHDFTDITNDIYAVAKKLLRDNISNVPIRLIGISCSSFVKNENNFRQLTLFDVEEEKLKKVIKVEEVVNNLKVKYGESIIKRARNIKNDNQ